MAERADVNREPRARLSRERVLRAAVRLADEGGIESLTMRRLGQELGVEAMSLYNHVAGKEDILDGMVDLVVSEIDLPSGGVDWKTGMRQRAVSARGVLSRHPWACGLIDSRRNAAPARLRYYDSVMGSLREAGFSIEMAAHAFSVLDSYIKGFSLQELSMSFDSEGELAKAATFLLRELSADEYPHLTELIRHTLESGHSYVDQFEFGLDLIIDGLVRFRGTPPATDGADTEHERGWDVESVRPHE